MTYPLCDQVYDHPCMSLLLESILERKQDPTHTAANSYDHNVLNVE